jgi:hypothetical protein
MWACLWQRLRWWWAEFIRRHEACEGQSLMARTGRLYLAWRTRLSELRTIDGLTVENRCRKVGAVTVSEYRLVRPSQPVQAALALEEHPGV